MTRYSLYSHDYQINDTVVCKHNYAYIPVGTRVKIAAITSTGALKFYGIKGTYNADNFERHSWDKPSNEIAIRISDALKFYGIESTYNADNFECKLSNEREETMTKPIQKYIAIRISDANLVSSKEHAYPEDYIDELANQIDLEGEMPPWGTLVASTKEEIQAKINRALRDNPQDIWMIFFGHTITKTEINISYRTI